MKFVFNLPHMLELKATMQPWELDITGADQTRMAKRADELGYDMIAVPEHFAIPDEHDGLSGPHYLQSTVAQAYLAGATSRIRLNSCITVLPLQHPIVLAKTLATADWMSSGRMMVTFGVGWLKHEFELLGVPFHERGRIADEYLAAIIELWTSDSPCFEGRYVSFSNIAFRAETHSEAPSAGVDRRRRRRLATAGRQVRHRVVVLSHPTRTDRRTGGLPQVTTRLRRTPVRGHARDGDPTGRGRPRRPRRPRRPTRHERAGNHRPPGLAERAGSHRQCGTTTHGQWG